MLFKNWMNQKENISTKSKLSLNRYLIVDSDKNDSQNYLNLIMKNKS